MSEEVKLLEQLNERLEAQLLMRERELMQLLINPHFYGDPKVITIASTCGGGKTITAAWLAANCFHMTNEDTLTVVTVDSMKPYLRICANNNPRLNDCDSIDKIDLNRPGVVVIENHFGNRDIIAKLPLQKNLRGGCRGIIVTEQLPRNGELIPEILQKTDILLKVDLKSDHKVIEVVKAPKIIGTAYFQIPKQILREIEV